MAARQVALDDPRWAEAERRLRAGDPVDRIARDLKLSRTTLQRRRAQLDGVVARPRGFPKGLRRKLTAETIEPDFIQWLTDWGASVTEGLHQLDGSPDRVRLLASAQRSGTLSPIDRRITVVSGVIESEAAQALFDRLTVGWDEVGRLSLRRRGVPATDQDAEAEGQRLQREVALRIELVLRDAEVRHFTPTSSDTYAGALVGQWLLLDGTLTSGDQDELDQWLRFHPAASA
jgi:hypothetical protein